jgi:hypothetical protein
MSDDADMTVLSVVCPCFILFFSISGIIYHKFSSSMYRITRLAREEEIIVCGGSLRVNFGSPA